MLSACFAEDACECFVSLIAEPAVAQVCSFSMALVKCQFADSGEVVGLKKT